MKDQKGKLIQIMSHMKKFKLDQKMVLDFRSDLFQHAQRLSLAFHDQKRSGPLIYAINFQADAAAGIVLAVLPILDSLLRVGGMFAIIYVLAVLFSAGAILLHYFDNLWLEALVLSGMLCLVALTLLRLGYLVTIWNSHSVLWLRQRVFAPAAAENPADK